MTSSMAAVVVGAGQAGYWVARTLRTEGFEGRIVVIGDEPHPPYERPPLSKAVLADTATAESTYFATHSQLLDSGIEWWPGETVTRLDRDAKSVVCAGGKTIDYDLVFLTMGGRPRALPGLPGGERVHYLRQLTDSEKLKTAMVGAESVLVIGGGWIGLEVAATARQQGKEVTVVETASHLCVRTLPPEISELIADLHRSHGVNLFLGSPASYTVGEGAVVAMFGNGTTIRADIAVVGIGMVPDSAIAADAGLTVADGIVVDAQGRTSDAAIFAAGDVASFPVLGSERRRRLESWANAQNSAIAAAKAALGHGGIYDEIPWFWSDQFNVNLQVLGVFGEDMKTVRRDYGGGRLVYFYLRHGRIEAAVAVNSGRDINPLRRLMRAQTVVDAALLRDPSISVQTLIVK